MTKSHAKYGPSVCLMLALLSGESLQQRWERHTGRIQFSPVRGVRWGVEKLFQHNLIFSAQKLPNSFIPSLIWFILKSWKGCIWPRLLWRNITQINFLDFSLSLDGCPAASTIYHNTNTSTNANTDTSTRKYKYACKFITPQLEFFIFSLSLNWTTKLAPQSFIRIFQYHSFSHKHWLH